MKSHYLIYSKSTCCPTWVPALVLRRTCLTPRALDNQVHRNLIFQSACTINGKVCHFIIDTGSCENVIASDAVERLGISPEPHPQPYSLAWLQNGNIILVNHRALVTFSIGNKFTDTLWCDIVPMDACHLLLGRPWQFDQSVVYDGRQNTYSFVHKGVKLVLLPSIPSSSPSTSSPLPVASSPSSSRVMLLSQAEFLRQWGANSPLFLLLPHTTSPSSGLPSFVADHLAEFVNIFPTDLPAGLPPLRDI